METAATEFFSEAIQWGFAGTTLILIFGGFWIVRMLLRVITGITAALTKFESAIENHSTCAKEQTSTFRELKEEIIRGR